MRFVRSSQDIPTKKSLFIFLHLFILFYFEIITTTFLPVDNTGFLSTVRK